jgi:hypothetical protein
VKERTSRLRKDNLSLSTGDALLRIGRHIREALKIPIFSRQWFRDGALA